MITPTLIATTGLTVTIQPETVTTGHYEGRPHESSAALIYVPFSASNPTGAPIRFSPFTWTGEAGRSTLLNAMLAAFPAGSQALMAVAQVQTQPRSLPARVWLPQRLI